MGKSIAVFHLDMITAKLLSTEQQAANKAAILIA